MSRSRARSTSGAAWAIGALPRVASRVASRESRREVSVVETEKRDEEEVVSAEQSWAGKGEGEEGERREREAEGEARESLDPTAPPDPALLTAPRVNAEVRESMTDETSRKERADSVLNGCEERCGAAEFVDNFRGLGAGM